MIYDAVDADQLQERLSAMGIATTTVEHPPVFTVADSSGAADNLPGAHTKNLFLKSQSGELVLVVAKSSTKIDLKQLARTLNAGRYSFANADLLMQHLGVAAGSVTAFAIANDASRRVDVVIDQELMQHESVNCHPLENTATTNIARDDLLRFIRATGREPKIIALTSAA